MKRVFAKSVLLAAILGIGLVRADTPTTQQTPPSASSAASPAAPTASQTASASPSPAAALSVGEQPTASVEQLKTQAFKAIRDGQFDRSNELLDQAAKISSDPTLAQMSQWVQQFDAQHQKFDAERQKQFDKACADVKTLLDKNMDTFAMDSAARAYSLAEDKDAFVKEDWVAGLLKKSIQMAADDESKDEWIKTARLYSDLSQMEPATAEWKDKLKLVMRRIRLLATYAPDTLKPVQDAEAKEREKADALLAPTTQASFPAPTTSPVTGEAMLNPTTKPLVSNPDDDDQFKIDWQETLKGITMPMLRTALVEAESNYWRGIDYKTLMIGGLKGIQAVSTTPGMEQAKDFGDLKDDAKRKEFNADLTSLIDHCNQTTPDNDSKLLGDTLDALMADNGNTVKLPEEVVVSEFADGAFAELDPFTSMIWPYDVEEFNKSTQGEFSGVGIQIQLGDDGSLKVVSPLEDSPAYKAGIKAGDVITRINGKSARGITINQAVKTITGVKGTNVRLTIRSQTKDGPTEKDYDIQRDVIKVASVKGWDRLPGGQWEYFVDPDNKIAYLRITNFTKTTGDEINKAVDEMRDQGAKAIIMDLRYNPGGLLTAATDVADKFLSEGVIVSTKTDPSRESTPQPPLEAHRSSDDCDLPLVVLVNQYSASASEIVSGALKDWKRALIVGERTFGKGSVQMLFPLHDRSAYLKLTTSHYYLPSGRCIHREENSTTWGVDPDVTIEMTPEQMSTAINAWQEQDVLRDNDANAAPTTQPKTDLLSVDPQLSAAVLLLRLELNGATI